MGREGSGLADAPRIAATPSSLLVLHGEPGSVMSLVPLLLHSPQDTATPLREGKIIVVKHFFRDLILRLIISRSNDIVENDVYVYLATL